MNDHKNHSVLIMDNGLFIPLAQKLAESFGKVIYFNPWANAFPKTNQTLIGVGLDNITKTNNFWDFVDEADIIVAPDVYCASETQYLSTHGKHVWASKYGEDLEVYRDKAKKHFKSLGLPVGAYEVIKGMTALRKYLKENDNQYIKIDLTRGDMETIHAENYQLIETRLDQLELDLGAKKTIMKFTVEEAITPAVEVGSDTYCIDGKYPIGGTVGIEVKDQGYVCQYKEFSKMPKQITNFNEKIADTLKNYSYRNFMSTELRVTPALTPYMIDFCFSDDTEVLTDNGWKPFQDLEKKDLICTMNAQTNIIEYQKPTDYIKNKFDGEMILITNTEKTIECLVTPSHGIWRTDRYGNGLFRQQADSLTDKGFIPRTGRWEGEYQEYFILPEYYHSWLSGKNGKIFKEKDCKEIKIKMDDWLKFMAIYIADGSLHNKYAVNITQSLNSTHLEEVKEILNKLPFEITYSGNSFVINSVQLTAYMRSLALGLCNTKFVPDYIKQLPSNQIGLFLSAYLITDGNIHKGQNLYYTTSKILADDLQELVLKCGRVADIREKDVKGTLMSVNGKTYKRNFNVYIISERSKFNKFWFETGCRKSQYIKKQKYNGFVYDVTVPNHIVYVRRNGKPFWSSNCARSGSPPSELFINMYDNLADIIWEGAHGNCIDPIVKHPYGIQAIIKSDWGEKHWQVIQVPDKIKDNVKFKYLTKINDETYVVPQNNEHGEIGALVATGDTLQEAIDKINEYADQVKGYQLDICIDAIDSGLKELEKLKGWGLEILT